MKKITNSAILAFILTTNIVNADSWYIGLEQSLVNKIDNTTEDNYYSQSYDKSSNVTSLKIGKVIGGEKGTHAEFFYNMGEKTANPIVKSSLMSLGLNWDVTTPSFIQSETILPYFRLGVNYVISDDTYNVYGSSDTTKYSAIGLILGVGGYYNINKNVELSAGFDFGYRIWEQLTNGWDDLDSTDKTKKLYVGVNYHF